MVRLILGIDLKVAIDTPHFFQLFALAQLADRAQILFDGFQLGLLVEGLIFRGEFSNLLEVRVRALLPCRHPSRRFICVALDALFPARHLFHRLRGLIEGVRVEILAERNGLPILAVLPLPLSILIGVHIPLEQRLVQVLRRGGPLNFQRLVGLFRNGGGNSPVPAPRRPRHRPPAHTSPGA